MEISLEQIRKEYPDIANALLDEGRTEGRKAGAKAELERIKAVRAQSLPGHEVLIEAMIEDGITTGEQAAIRILQAEKQLRATAASNIASDAGNVPSVPVTTPPAIETLGNAEDLSTEDGMKAAWEKNAELRKEFSSFETFKAYEQNKHRAKVRG